jgi:uncharacterized protein YrrD
MRRSAVDTGVRRSLCGNVQIRDAHGRKIKLITFHLPHPGAINMLRSATELQGYAIAATDGDIGHVKDLYFDDHSWVIRYLVVNTGNWLAGKRVLISPIALGKPNWHEKQLPVFITREQVKNGPDIDTDRPVSAQQERDYYGYYGYPYYWGGIGIWGGGYYPGYLQAGIRADEYPSDYGVTREHRARAEGEDPHLRSCKEVVGYHIDAIDGEIGHVASMLVDERSWAIRYLVVDTSNWWGGHQVLIAPEWISRVSWDSRQVTVSLTREAVKDSPNYNSTEELNRASETGLYAHYGRLSYWTADARHEGRR